MEKTNVRLLQLIIKATANEHQIISEVATMLKKNNITIAGIYEILEDDIGEISSERRNELITKIKKSIGEFPIDTKKQGLFKQALENELNATVKEVIS